MKFDDHSELQSHSTRARGKNGWNFTFEDGGQTYFLKKLSKDLCNPILLKQLRNEALYNFSIEGLPKNVSLIEDDDFLYLERPFITGLELFEFWKTVPKKKRECVFKKLSQQITDLLQHIHSMGITHCDLKPSNIIIERNDSGFKTHLIDFGMARKGMEQKKTLFQLKYSAPEMILNQSELINPLSDQFSMGLILYELLNGSPSYTHSHPAILTNLQLTYPLEKPFTWHKNFFGILSKATTKPAFKISPNQYSKQEIEELLKQAQETRFENILELNQAIQESKIYRFTKGYLF